MSIKGRRASRPEKRRASSGVAERAGSTITSRGSRAPPRAAHPGTRITRPNRAPTHRAVPTCPHTMNEMSVRNNFISDSSRQPYVSILGFYLCFPRQLSFSLKFPNKSCPKIK